jgi:hypothetical protein
MPSGRIIRSSFWHEKDADKQACDLAASITAGVSYIEWGTYPNYGLDSFVMPGADGPNHIPMEIPEDVEEVVKGHATAAYAGRLVAVAALDRLRELQDMWGEAVFALQMIAKYKAVRTSQLKSLTVRQRAMEIEKDYIRSMLRGMPDAKWPRIERIREIGCRPDGTNKSRVAALASMRRTGEVFSSRRGYVGLATERQSAEERRRNDNV